MATVLLALAAFLLSLFPRRTETLWAWTIRPAMTPLVMGAGYTAATYFATRSLFARRWHEIELSFVPITAFTVCMSVATFLHLDRFHRDNLLFYVWTVFYVITPVIVPLAWLRNRSADPGTLAPDDARIPRGIGWSLGILGIAQGLLGLTMFVVPSAAIRFWPWQLTPLTSQVLGGWFLLGGITALRMALDRRWSAIKITYESQVIGMALLLVGAARAWGDFRAGPAMWLYLLAIAGLFATLLGMYLLMERRRRARAVSSRGIRDSPSVAD
jgi:hypothetical protein